MTPWRVPRKGRDVAKKLHVLPLADIAGAGASLGIRKALRAL